MPEFILTRMGESTPGTDFFVSYEAPNWFVRRENGPTSEPMKTVDAYALLCKVSTAYSGDGGVRYACEAMYTTLLYPKKNAAFEPAEYGYELWDSFMDLAKCTDYNPYLFSGYKAEELVFVKGIGYKFADTFQTFNANMLDMLAAKGRPYVVSDGGTFPIKFAKAAIKWSDSTFLLRSGILRSLHDRGEWVVEQVTIYAAHSASTHCLKLLLEIAGPQIKKKLANSESLLRELQRLHTTEKMEEVLKILRT
jgi:hypothetical protein